jgi:hypothetical protein
MSTMTSHSGCHSFLWISAILLLAAPTLAFMVSPNTTPYPSFFHNAVVRIETATTTELFSTPPPRQPRRMLKKVGNITDACHVKASFLLDLIFCHWNLLVVVSISIVFGLYLLILLTTEKTTTRTVTSCG